MRAAARAGLDPARVRPAGCGGRGPGRRPVRPVAARAHRRYRPAGSRRPAGRLARRGRRRLAAHPPGRLPRRPRHRADRRGRGRRAATRDRKDDDSVYCGHSGAGADPDQGVGARTGPRGHAARGGPPRGAGRARRRAGQPAGAGPGRERRPRPAGPRAARPVPPRRVHPHRRRPLRAHRTVPAAAPRPPAQHGGHGAVGRRGVGLAGMAEAGRVGAHR